MEETYVSVDEPDNVVKFGKAVAKAPAPFWNKQKLNNMGSVLIWNCG